VQDAFANFIEIIPQVPVHILESRTGQIMSVIVRKLYDKVGVRAPFIKGHTSIANVEEYNRVLACNNMCWTIGELAMRAPE
jgi:hypothetical protein